MKTRTVIVEDEAIAREVLQNYILKYCPQLQIIGMAQNIKEAVPLIHDVKPDLVFLDVEMPFGNAFDVLEACKDVEFETIFATAFSEYSLKALNRSAAYYLLKPINIEELISAVNKVYSKLEAKDSFNRNRIIIENLREKKSDKWQLTIPTVEGFDVVKMEQIIRFRGNGNFTDVYLTDASKKMACRFLKHFEDLLPENFLRVHKSHIINLNYVKQYHKGNGGYVTMNDNSEVEISANYKDLFLSKFK